MRGGWPDLASVGLQQQARCMGQNKPPKAMQLCFRTMSRHQATENGPHAARGRVGLRHVEPPRLPLPVPELLRKQQGGAATATGIWVTARERLGQRQACGSVASERSTRVLAADAVVAA